SESCLSYCFWPSLPFLKWDFHTDELIHVHLNIKNIPQLLPDSTMTYRGRSDGLVVESERKKCITFKFTRRHLRDLQGYCVYTSGVFFFFFLGSASPQSPLWTSRPCSIYIYISP